MNSYACKQNAQVCRNKTRKAETQTEFQLVRNTKGSWKGFYKYPLNKRKTKGRRIPLPNEKKSK